MDLFLVCAIFIEAIVWVAVILNNWLDKEEERLEEMDNRRNEAYLRVIRNRFDD